MRGGISAPLLGPSTFANTSKEGNKGKVSQKRVVLPVKSYCVDLSNDVSKHIGETEKNRGRVLVAGDTLALAGCPARRARDQDWRRGGGHSL